VAPTIHRTRAARPAVHRWRRGLGLLLLLACFAGPRDAHGDDVPSLEATAQALVEAWKEGRYARLGEIATASTYDPWLVADALLALGERRCAIAFAERFEYAEARFLAAYVHRPEAAERQLSLREALRTVGETLAAEHARLSSNRPRYGTVLAVLHARRRAELARRASFEAQARADAPGRAALRGTELGAASRYNLRAIAAAGEAAWAAARIGWRRRAAYELNHAGTIALDSGRRPREAAEWFRRAQRQALAAVAMFELAEALNGIGCALGLLGELESSARAFRESADAFERARRPDLAATALSNGGVAWHLMGRFSAALRTLDEAREAARRAETAGLPSLEDVWALIWRAGVWLELQYFEQARLDLDQAAAEVTRRNAPAAVSAYGWAQIAEMHRAAGNLAQAAFASAAALNHFKNANDPLGYAQALLNDALILRANGLLARAIVQLEDARLRLRDLNSPVFALRAEAEMADTLLAAGRVDASIALHQHVLARATGFGSVDLASREWGALATCRRRQGDLVGSVLAARALAWRIGGVVGGLGDEESSLVRDRFATAFYDGAWAAARLGDVGSVVELLEAGRAGALLEALGGRSRLFALTVPAEVQEELRLLQAAETRARSAFLEGGASIGELRRAQADVAAFVSRMQRDAKARSGLAYPSVDGLPALQKDLATGDVLVVYALPEQGGTDDAFAVRIDRERAVVAFLGPADRVREVAHRLIEASSAPAGRFLSPKVARELLDEARAVLVAPLRLGDDVRRVLISPDDEFAFVPYARLLAGGVLSRADEKITGPDVHLIPSGTVLGEIRRQDGAVRGLTRCEEVVALADPYYDIGPGGKRWDRLPLDKPYSPLPRTRAEAEAVTPHPLLGRDATEAGFRRSMEAVPTDQRLRAILLAAHGVIREASPLRSAIALTPEGDDDGDLTALEITQLSVRADLVVLSACESGLGGHARGEGVLGLVRAFMFAGAPRVLASTWRVDDGATQVLMTHFFERLKTGDRPALALRKAQEHVRNAKPKWNDPYYWAAWVLWGLPD
jgi:tetratricopeptide (TPR) repeat protein